MKKDIYLILDNIHSRENVGSIFRTADGAGVKKIFLCGITPCPQLDNYGLRIMNSKDNTESVIRNRVIDKISKTALGAEKWVPWEYRRNTWRLLAELKAQGLKLVALEQTKDSEDIFRLKRDKLKAKTLALIVGNEVKGISPKILKYCDKKISIPMYGKKESLNVAVAAGIALYSLRGI
ncbi:MAG: RNA methyltransferase [Candidatus Yanofskybacteria bacterium]|nr:RNA methyltransferase [Candidatus Yanofskybacteria bacterium]